MVFAMTATDILAQGTLPDNVQNSDCTYTPEAFQWGITEKWSSSLNVSTLLIPMVGDVDGDAIPEIVCFAPSGDDYYNANTVLMFDSQTHEVIHSFTIPGDVSTVDAAPYGIVKLHNGHVLFAVCTQDYNMYGYDLTSHGTSPLWTASTQQVAPNVGFADFNGDGYPEIYVGKRIYDAETGTMLIDATAVSNIGGSYAHLGRDLSSPFVTNILGDDHPELILGNEIYSVNITNRTGLNGNTISLAQSCTPPSGIGIDGHPQVADFNLDGYLDVFISNKTSNSNVGCYVWDVHNNTVSQPLVISTVGSGKSIPLIADIDGDDLLEMVIQCQVSGNKIRAYKYTPTTRTFTMMWDFAVDEDSYSNGATTFDFNHDNEMEILISDQSHIKILEGTTGTTITELSFGECTVMQYPIIADVDADGAAEIIICGQFGSGHTNSGHLVVFCSSTVPWAPARKVWNQYMYNVTNVNEDLSIPIYVFNNATPFTWQGTTRRPYNNFLQQATMIDQHGNPFNTVPDAVMNSSEITFNASSATLNFTYSNQGTNTLNAPYKITVFVDQLGGTIVHTFTINEPLISEVSVQQQLNLSMEDLCQLLNGHDLVIAINCEGGGIAQDGGLQPECDVFNNMATIPISIEPIESSFYETECDVFTWNGQPYTQSGDYTQTLQNHYGCDSIVTLHLTINYSEDIPPATITECDSYSWHGTTYTSSGIYEFDTLTEQGCNKHEILNLFINYSENIDPVSVTACDTYTWHGTTYTQSGTYNFETTTAQGCERTETLHLTINHSENEEFNVTACDSYTWNGTTYHVNGTYTFETTTEAGCPRTETLHLTISDVSHTEFSQQACEDFTWNGMTYTASGDYTQQFNSTQGCDSIVTLHLTINHNEEENYNITACDSYTWNGTTYDSGGTYTFETTTAQGCPRTETLVLVISDVFQTEFSQQACESFIWNGTTYDASGDYTQEFTSIQGCDSIATLHLTVNNAFTIEWTQQAYNSFTWNETTYYESGDYTQSFTTQQGCDSIVTLHLTIDHEVVDNEWVATACDSYVWNGITYNTSGDYTQHFPSQHEGDSIVTLHLSVYHATETEWSDQACDSYEWNGITYNNSGDYTQQFTSQHGCDSTVTLHLSLGHSEEKHINITACESYLWNGTLYTQSGTYEHMEQTAEGCDSLLVLHLNIGTKFISEESLAACDSYFWRGNNYTASGTYEDEAPNPGGCDSTFILNLTINHSTTTQINEAACNEFEWNGTIYYESGTYSYVGQSIMGCDSVVVLNLSMEAGLPVNIQGPTSIYTATNLVSGNYTYQIDSANIDPANVHWSISRDDWHIEPHRASCKVYCLTTGEAILRAWTENEFCNIDTTIILQSTFFDVGENDDSSLAVYPNPTKGLVTVSWHDIEEVTVIDMLGQRLATYTFGKVESCKLDISTFAHGAYLLEIVSSTGKAYRHVVRGE